MRIGISSACLYPEQTESSLEILGKSGVKNTEVFINSACELKREFILKLAEIKNRYSMNILSMHPFSSGTEPFMIFTEYERRYADALEAYKRYFEAMNILGAKILVFHGDKKQSKFPEQAYFERFSGLKTLAEGFGVTVAQENVARCKSSDIGFVKRMREAIPDVGFVLDVKQCVRSGVSAFELLDTMGKNLAHVHLSDNIVGADCLPVGKGEFDFHKLFAALNELGYDKGAILELYRDNYGGVGDLLESHRKTVEIFNESRKLRDAENGFNEKNTLGF